MIRDPQVGDRVVVPDPMKVNPFGGTPSPHGPGSVTEVTPPKYRDGRPICTVLLDSGATRKVGAAFLSAEVA